MFQPWSSSSSLNTGHPPPLLLPPTSTSIHAHHGATPDVELHRTKPYHVVLTTDVEGKCGIVESLVISTPEIKIIEFGDEDRYLLLACDGLFDVMTNAEAVGFVNEQLRAGETLEDVAKNMVVRAVQELYTTDNCTVVLVELTPGGCSPGEVVVVPMMGEDATAAASPVKTIETGTSATMTPSKELQPEPSTLVERGNTHDDANRQQQPRWKRWFSDCLFPQHIEGLDDY